MSKVQLQGNVSGTGIFTIASPNSNTDRTLTLPDNTGTLLSSGAAVTVAQGGTGRTTALAECSAILTSASSNFGDNTFTKCSFNSATFDNYSAFSSGQYTIPTAGVYTITTTVYMRNASGGLSNQYLLRIYKNGSDISASEVDFNGAYSYGFTLTSTWNGTLAANDVIAVYGYHSTGSASNQYYFVGNGCTFNIRQLS